jgi:hypothetical protein
MVGAQRAYIVGGDIAVYLLGDIGDFWRFA